MRARNGKRYNGSSAHSGAQFHTTSITLWHWRQCWCCVKQYVSSVSVNFCHLCSDLEFSPMSTNMWFWQDDGRQPQTTTTTQHTSVQRPPARADPGIHHSLQQWYCCHSSQRPDASKSKPAQPCLRFKPRHHAALPLSYTLTLPSLWRMLSSSGRPQLTVIHDGTAQHQRQHQIMRHTQACSDGKPAHTQQGQQRVTCSGDMPRHAAGHCHPCPASKTSSLSRCSLSAPQMGCRQCWRHSSTNTAKLNTRVSQHTWSTAQPAKQPTQGRLCTLCTGREQGARALPGRAGIAGIIITPHDRCTRRCAVQSAVSQLVSENRTPM